VVDPLAGSYYLEWLTNELEKGAEQYFKQIEEIGGVINGIEKGYFMKEIADAAYTFQKKMDSGERIFVGLNAFEEEAPGSKIEILKIGPEYQERQCERLAKLKAKRNKTLVHESLNALKEGMRAGRNSMPLILTAVKAYATLGEISEAMKEVWGDYRETAVL
jgi:methylmalonyl-CoA mutase N-terminal domain/subunit